MKSNPVVGLFRALFFTMNYAGSNLSIFQDNSEKCQKVLSFQCKLFTETSSQRDGVSVCPLFL